MGDDFYNGLYDDATLAQVIASGAVADHATDTILAECRWLRWVFVFALPDGRVRVSGKYHGHTFVAEGAAHEVAAAFNEQRAKIARPWLAKLWGRSA